MSAATTEDRRVRVTLTGTARPVTSLLHGNVLRIDTGERVLLVNADAAGVTVEDLAHERTWTDGDVVQHPDLGWTLTRQGGTWVSSMGEAPSRGWTDETVTERVAESAEGWGQLTVLRYQADERPAGVVADLLDGSAHQVHVGHDLDPSCLESRGRDGKLRGECITGTAG